MAQKDATGATGSPVSAWPQVKLRLHPDTRERVTYWRKSRGIAADSDYMVQAIEEKIARENGDYDLPDILVQRINQIVDELRSNSTSIASLESVMVSSFKSLLGLTRGDSYLSDDESGELASPEDDGEVVAP